MHQGRGSEDQQVPAPVTVDILDGKGHPQSVKTILDTGFTGYLTLPTESIQQLGLLSVGQRAFELAKGELFGFETYLAAGTWHGRLSDELVLK